MTIAPLDFKSKPFDHQAAELISHGEKKAHARYWDQGTGKTKVGIDETVHARRVGRVRAGIVVAPGGVDRNWVTDELPAHWSDDVPYRAHLFETSRASTRWHRNAVADLLKVDRQFPILAMDYDAWMTDAGKQAAWDLMRSRPTFLHVDECHNLKTWNARRSQSLLKGSVWAEMIRIYSGTPLDGSPFELYLQVMLIDKDFWARELGIHTYVDFKAFFGIFVQNQRRPTPEEKERNQEGRVYPTLVAYQNLPVMNELLKKISTRVLKDDVLDLPPKLYTKRYYEMTPAQKRMYDTLDEQYMVDFPDDPEAMVTAELPIVRMTRLQQILCGYVPADDDEEPRELIDRKKNPRADATTEFVTEAGNQQTIVWGQYRLDVDIVMERLQAEGRRPVRYDGKVDDNERARAKEGFKAGDYSDFVGNTSVGAEGLTLVTGATMAFHSNNYRRIKRRQAEDRMHRIGQNKSCLYGDMVCRGTRDERAIEIFQKKQRISDKILGDAPKEWL